jgi:hypothetical protein
MPSRAAEFALLARIIWRLAHPLTDEHWRAPTATEVEEFFTGPHDPPTWEQWFFDVADELRAFRERPTSGCLNPSAEESVVVRRIEKRFRHIPTEALPLLIAFYLETVSNALSRRTAGARRPKPLPHLERGFRKRSDSYFALNWALTRGEWRQVPDASPLRVELLRRFCAMVDAPAIRRDFGKETKQAGRVLGVRRKRGYSAAELSGCSRQKVSHWRARFGRSGIDQIVSFFNSLVQRLHSPSEKRERVRWRNPEPETANADAADIRELFANESDGRQAAKRRVTQES